MSNVSEASDEVVSEAPLAASPTASPEAQGWYPKRPQNLEETGLSPALVRDLILKTGSGEVVQKAPVIYQEVDGERRHIAGRYVLLDSHSTLNAQGSKPLHFGFRISTYDRSVVHIVFFDKSGMDLDKGTQRKIESAFFREDFRRAHLDDIGTTSYVPAVIERYTNAFLGAIDRDAIAHSNYRLVVDYSLGSSSEFLPPILQELGCNAVRLVDLGRGLEQADRRQDAVSRLKQEVATDSRQKTPFRAAMNSMAESGASRASSACMFLKYSPAWELDGVMKPATPQSFACLSSSSVHYS